jgi:drug/metabolite transporter (DMT)-like permease
MADQQHVKWVHPALFTVTLIYGFYYVGIKLLLAQGLSANEIVFLRMLLTALVVGLVECFLIKTKFENTRDFWKLAGLSLIGVLGVQFLVVLGTKYTSAFHASLLMATIPIQTLLLSLITGREAFNVRKLGGIALAFAGVAVLLSNRFSGGPFVESSLFGDLIILFTALLYSLFLVLSEPLVKKYHAFSFMAYGYLVSGLVTLGGYQAMHWGHWDALSWDLIRSVSLSGWLLIAYMVIFASIITYTLNNYALTHTRPSTVAAYIFIQPLISAVLAYIFLHEPFTWGMGIAGFVIFVGMVLARTSAKSPQPQPIEFMKS